MIVSRMNSEDEVESSSSLQNNSRAPRISKMASPRQVYAFLLTSSVLLFFFFFISQSQVTSDNYSAAKLVEFPTSSSAAKVDLSLYYESLCPYCANFIVNQLVKVFQTDLISIVNLRLFPWGNSQRTTYNTWTCQHGEDECLLNTVQACAVYLWPAPQVHFKLIQCIELLSLEGKHNQWPSCLGAMGLNQESMKHCYTSATGFQLELKYAIETEHLKPPHRFVPWVLVNNIALQQDYQNYIVYICKAYTGPNKPAACNPHLEFNSSDMSNTIPPVCHKNFTSMTHEEITAGSAKASSTHRKKETPT